MLDSSPTSEEPAPVAGENVPEQVPEIAPKKFLTANRRLGLWAVGIALVTKLALFAWGVHEFNFKKNPTETAITIWSEWDSLTYLRIADKHYSAEGMPKDQHEFDSHFPPFHPLLIRCVTEGLHVSPELAALLVSWSAGLIAAYLLAQLAWYEFRDTWSVIMSGILFHVYPAAYFLITPYSESVSFLLIFTAFYFLRVRPRPILCATSLGLAILTRLLSITLAPVLGLKLFLEVRARKISAWNLLVLGFPLVAVGIYLAINYFVYGSPFFFLHHVYTDPMIPRKPAIPLRETVSALWHFADELSRPKRMRFFMETLGWNSLFTAFVLLVTLWGIIKKAIPWEYSIYSLCYILFFSSFEWGIGNVRYSYGAFPIFFILARSVTRTLLWEWLAISVCLLLYFTQRYTNGLWAF